MKKWWIALLMAVFLTACGNSESESAAEQKAEVETTDEKETAGTEEAGEGNTLFENAVPAQSVMEFYYYDGAAGYRDWISDDAKEKEIIEDLSQVTATPVDSMDFEFTYPMYGMSIADGDMGINVLWTNGYLITRSGEVYEFNYDWEATMDGLEWGSEESRKTGNETRRDIQHVAEMPNVRYLALQDDAWNPEMMKPADKIEVPEGVSAELKSWEQDTVTVILYNDGEEDWMYGSTYRLDILIEDQWYEVPVTADVNWGFTSEAIYLTPDEDNEASYSMQMFGDIPGGTYRLVVLDDLQRGVWVEHEVAAE